MNDNSRLIAQQGFWRGIHSGMGLASKAMIVSFVVFTALWVDFAGGLYSSVRGWVEATLNWYYVTIFAFLFILCLYLMFSRYGSIRLGSDDSRPEFRNFSWFAMLFSAGVGIGILFFGVAEPIFYFDNSGGFGYPNNPFADEQGATALDASRASAAMRVTYFHWGFHAWAIYVIFGLALAYFGFRRGLPLTLRSSLYPLIGNRIYGPVGHAVDLLAIFGTVFGVATSLGLGVQQMAAGLNHLFGIDAGVITQVILIAIISVIATVSAVSGVGKGIRIISEWNIWLSIVLLAYFMFGGPFGWLMGFFLTSFGDYLSNMLEMDSELLLTRTRWHGRGAGRSSTGGGGFPGRLSSACSSRGFPAGGRFASSCSASCWCRPSSPSSGFACLAATPSIWRCRRWRPAATRESLRPSWLGICRKRFTAPLTRSHTSTG